MSPADDNTRPETRFDVSGTARDAYQIERLGSLNVTHNHYGDKPEPDGEPKVPRELPRPNRRFLNRSEELDLLEELLDRNPNPIGPRLLLVDGEEGVGKTALVALWGTRITDRFRHGTIYCNLAAYTIDDFVDLAEVLGSLLKSAGVKREDLFDTVEGRARQWRSATYERELMVVLDNIEDPALLEYLEPSSPATTVVLISRVNAAAFLAEGADRVNVDQLEPEHLRTLLSRICGPRRLHTEPEAVVGLLDLCRGRPGTVALLGGCLATTPTLSLSALLREIASQSQVHGHETTKVITRRIAVESLSADARRLYRIAAAHPGEDLPAELIEAVAPAPVPRLLAELGKAELVSTGPDGRWRAPGGGNTDPEAFRTILDWYLAMARHADRTATSPQRLRLSVVDESKAPAPQWGNPGDGLDWLDRELRNLVAIQNAAVAHGWDEAAVAIEESLWVLYLKRSFPGFQEATSRLAVEAATRLPDRGFESRMRAQRGRLLWQRGDHEQALSESLLARDLATTPELVASAAEMTSRVHLATRRFDEAVTVLTGALRLYEQLDDTRGLAMTRQFLAQAYTGLDRDDLAAPLFQQAHTGFVAIGAKPDQGRVLLDLARLDDRLGRPDPALSALEQATELLDRAGMHQRRSAAYELGGDILDRLDRPDAARAAWEAALQAQLAQHNGDGPEASQLRAKIRAT